MPDIQAVEAHRGEPVQLNFTASPVEDITAWTITFTLASQRNLGRKTRKREQALQKAATILSGPDGTFRVTLTSADMDREPRLYWWDVWRTNAGQERLLAIGNLTISGCVRLPSDA